jgi:hypothetical protein
MLSLEKKFGITDKREGWSDEENFLGLDHGWNTDVVCWLRD